MMLEAVTMVVWALMVPLITATAHAQGGDITAEDFLMGGLDLTRSGSHSLPCSTPDDQQGECRSATTCRDYLPLLRDLRNNTVLTFFRERVCRHSMKLIHVCCPIQRPLQAPAPTRRPQGSILFGPPVEVPQSPARSSHRPSQRPNARRPAQGGSSNESDDEEDKLVFLNPLVLPTRSPPMRFEPQPPPPRPTLRPTTTTRAPTLVLPQLPPSTGLLMRPDREPPVSGSLNSAKTASQNQDPPPTEPPVPPILPAEGKCGTTPQGRTGTMPWMVGVGVLNKTEFRVTCGGALISRQHVIVAAHCLHAPAPTHVRLGDMERRGPSVDVSLLSWVHPSYNPATRDNDLALLTLDTSVTFTDNIQPVCLPFPYRLDGFRGQELQVVGWTGRGSVEAGMVQVIGLGKCRDAYRSPSLISNNEVAPFSRPSSSSSSSSSSFSLSPRTTSGVVVDRRHLCGSPAPSASSSGPCLSDYGAPLFFHDEDTTGLHFLAGVSSLGEGCGAGPGLYTRVGAFIPWLAKQLSAVEASPPSPAPSPTRNQAPRPPLPRIPELFHRRRG